jgi:hypothetical protein
VQRQNCIYDTVQYLQVFVTDKRKIKQYDRQEPPGRIRKALLAEVHWNILSAVEHTFSCRQQLSYIHHRSLYCCVLAAPANRL